MVAAAKAAVEAKKAAAENEEEKGAAADQGELEQVAETTNVAKIAVEDNFDIDDI